MGTLAKVTGDARAFREKRPSNLFQDVAKDLFRNELLRSCRAPAAILRLSSRSFSGCNSKASAITPALLLCAGAENSRTSQQAGNRDRISSVAWGTRQLIRKSLAPALFLLLWCGDHAFAQPGRTIADFLSECSKKHDVWSECSFAVTTMGIYDETNQLGTHSTCPPRSKSQADTELQTLSVMNWLSAHPKTQSLAEPDGILAALTALYPCPKESGKKSED